MKSFREIEKLKEELRVRRESEDQMKQVIENITSVDMNNNSLYTRFLKNMRRLSLS